MKITKRKLQLASTFAALLCAPVFAALTPVGAGNISDTINTASHRCVIDHGTWIWNAGVVEPGVSGCNPIGAPTPRFPQVQDQAANQPTMTHRWWGSVSFMGEHGINDPAGAGYLTPDPFAVRISNRGARLSGIPAALSTNASQTVSTIPDPFAEVFDGIAVGNSQHGNLQARLSNYSDGSVTVAWSDGATRVMEATFVHGSPYAYFTVQSGQLQLRTKAANGGERGVFHQDGNSLGVWTDVAGIRNHFLAVVPSGNNFSGVNGQTVTLSGNRLTLAWVPTAPEANVINLLKAHALNPVDEVRIDYEVDHNTQAVTVTHSYRYQGQAQTTLAGLLPMAWKRSNQPLTGYATRSARGVTRFAETHQFSYTLPFVGLLPSLPAFGSYDQATLAALVREFTDRPQSEWNTATDTYWAGKNYGKVAELAALARSHGLIAEADQLIAWLKAELEDWFRADTNGSLDVSKYFVYDANWNTLLGFDESFGAQQQLNDHHFHYGYFVRAAAEICRVDRSWCGDDAWGPMVELLIRDYAGGRNDALFPYLRNFDPANGFSWASGHANFVQGNNNESTSEAANAYGAMVLYGLITGNEAIRDRGVYLHASSTNAYWEYWNNIDRYRGLGGNRDNFDPAYPKLTTSIIWGSGHVFSTWFSGAYAHILGIQGLPLSPLVLHIGQEADYLRDYVALGLSESSNGKPSGLVDDQWRDVWWNIWAMTDAEAAFADFQSYGTGYAPEAGETKAHTYQWLQAFRQLGQVAAVPASSPAAAAFRKAGVTTYVAYNYGNSYQYVTFADGMALSVAPHSFRIRRSGDTPDQPGQQTPADGLVNGGTGGGGDNGGGNDGGGNDGGGNDGGGTPTDCINGCATESGASLILSLTRGDVVDLHFRVNGGAQQNLRMTATSAGWTYEIGGLSAYDQVDYSFTVITAGVGEDIGWRTHTFNGTGGGDGSGGGDGGEPPAPDCLNGCALPVSGGVQFAADEADIADVHYTVNGGAQQNVRMQREATGWRYQVTGLQPGDQVSYSFTLITNGVGRDTGWAQFTVSN